MVDVTMQIRVNASALKKTKWHEYAIRFLIGGLITAFAGIIAKKFGPGVGGLFLAFPAIFPATLIEKHEKRSGKGTRTNGTDHARNAAGADAAGSAMGSIGLFSFALVVWKLLPRSTVWATLMAATMAWFTISIVVWLIFGGRHPVAQD